MKKIIICILSVGLLTLSGCNNDMLISDIKGQFGVQIEKRTVRMINIDGELYYDSGRISEVVRCGVLDGALKKTVNENEIPYNSGDANFDADGYQRVSDRIEVYADSKWLIFDKYDNNGQQLDGLKCCYYIRGRLNNANVDSEVIVLSDNENVTFNDIFDPLLSSEYKRNTGGGKIHYNFITSDKWGINLRVKNVTPTGMTLLIEQSGGTLSGELETGSDYTIEQKINNVWSPLESKIDVWTLIAYDVKKNDTKEMEIDWKAIYGELDTGFYRLKKEIMAVETGRGYDKKIYEVYFKLGE